MNNKDREDPFYLAKLSLERLNRVRELPPAVDLINLQRNAALIYQDLSAVTRFYGHGYGEGLRRYIRLDLEAGGDLMTLRTGETYMEATRLSEKKYYYLLIVRDPMGRSDEVNKLELSWSGIKFENRNSGVMRIPTAQILDSKDRDRWIAEIGEPLVRNKFKNLQEEESISKTVNQGLILVAMDVSEAFRYR